MKTEKVMLADVLDRLETSIGQLQEKAGENGK